MGNNKTTHLNQKEVLDAFEYKDGKLYWKLKASRKTIIGQEAGTTNNKGYRIVVWNKKRYRSHHLVYLMFKGVIPDQVDHINGDKQDNHIENLRAANNSQNQWNKKNYANNKTGHKNVKWVERIRKYVVSISVCGKSKHIGVFDDINNAVISAKQARNLYHGDFACHN